MNILICGDSFAADWQVKYPDQQGWPNQLALQHRVINLAQAGCSEYKILLQLLSADLPSYDRIIVSHTSPYRLYVTEHPVHHRDPLHHNSDLIYTDLKEHSNTHTNLGPIIEYFERYADTDHMKFMHRLLCQHIDQLLTPYPTTHITNLDWSNLYLFPNMLNFEGLFATNRGLMNHYNAEGNQHILDRILACL